MNALTAILALAIPAAAQVKWLALPEAAVAPAAPVSQFLAAAPPAPGLSANMPRLPAPAASVAKGVIASFFKRDPGALAQDLAVAAEPAPKEGVTLVAPTVVDREGVERRLSYDPAAPQETLAAAGWRTLKTLPDRLRRVRDALRRVDALINDVTDEQLRWSFGRLESLASQEGILRSDNGPLVNTWNDRDQIKSLSPRDYETSSLDPVSVMKLFKTAMDLEEPTLQYQYAFAQSLHNRLPRLSHFLGTTFQERVLQVALKGKPGQPAIWSTEEVRHGPILERVYNLTRLPGLPELAQQGTAARLPRYGDDYVARSGMSNRSEAELGAAVAYLLLRANAKPASPAERVLDGVFRDEIYHYVIMAAVNRFTLGHRSRWKRLFLIFRHDLDFRPQGPHDRVRHLRPAVSPLLALEYGYALNAVDKRVERYLDSLDPGEARRVIGPYYQTNADIADAVARGEHSWTSLFPMEVNPALTKAQLERLAERMPRNYSLERRAVKAGQLDDIILHYRRSSLSNPQYWLRKKGFRSLEGRVLERDLPGSPGARLRLTFNPSASTEAAVIDRGRAVWRARLEGMTMPQIGAFIDAEDLGVIEKLAAAPPDLIHEELLKRLSNNPAYQKDPIRLLPD